MVTLIIQAEGEAPSSRELTPGTLTIGRRSDNHIRITDSTVSGHHAKIVTYFNASYVEDLGSTNGTTVNGRRVRMHTLRAGDVVAIGRHTLTVQAEAGAATPEPTGRFEPERTMVLSSTELDCAVAEIECAVAPPPQRKPEPPVPAAAASAPAQSAGGPHLRIMVGPSTGERIYLGDTGVDLDAGVNVRCKDGTFYFTRGSAHAGVPVRLNSREVGVEPVALKDMDMLQVGSIWLAYFNR